MFLFSIAFSSPPLSSFKKNKNKTVAISTSLKTFTIEYSGGMSSFAPFPRMPTQSL